MSSSRRSVAAVAALLAIPSIAMAALKDVGPVDPVTGFPQWYRDTTGAALSLCTEMRPSPNAAAGGSPMCFPVVPDPAGYPGNLGGEVFYYNASTSMTGPGQFSILWEGAIEATYATGVPIRGDEITFARIRVVMSTPTPGTYTVTHPYGSEVFPNVPGGKRAVFYTIDIGVSPGVFTGALAGAVGPFLEWDRNVADPTAPFGIDPVSATPYQLGVSNPDGTSVQFVGDPNFFHTVMGSPFGTNFVRVDGPPGSNLDGLGNDFLVTNLFAVVGQRYTMPIPVPLEMYRANVSVDPRGLAQVNVFAETVPGARLIATAPNVPTIELSVDPLNGEAYGSVEFYPTGPIAAQMTVTNIADDPHSSAVGPLTDFIVTGPAVMFPDPTGFTAGTVSIVGETSIKLNPPTLAVVELPGATWSVPDPTTPWIQRFDATLPAGSTPPWHLTVVSPLGGSSYEYIQLGATNVVASIGPTALAAAITTPESTPVTVTVVDPLTPASVMVLNPPANGTAVADADPVTGATLGTITYTPKNLFFGVDSFTYLLYVPDPANPAKPLYSNLATVTVDVTATNNRPVAVADSATTTSGVPVTIAVAANDTDVDGTVVPTSVVLTSQPLAGTAVVNLDGTVTYSPGIAGTFTFTYTVADNGGAVSANGTVTVVVSALPEVITVTSARWIIASNRWRITGTSSIFGLGIANKVNVHVGLVPNLGADIGTATVDATGAWSLDVTNPATAPDATLQVTAISTGGGIGVGIVQLK